MYLHVFAEVVLTIYTNSEKIEFVWSLVQLQTVSKDFTSCSFDTNLNVDTSSINACKSALLEAKISHCEDSSAMVFLLMFCKIFGSRCGIHASVRSGEL